MTIAVFTLMVYCSIPTIGMRTGDTTRYFLIGALKFKSQSIGGLFQLI